MNKTFITLIFFLIISQISFAQQEKIYYDSEWKVSNKSNADYYRLITFDENGKPKGKVKDFYITGELQWEGYFSSVDKYDNSKDINEGECIWYYKNGNKSRRSNMINNLQNGLTTYWYENGNKSSEAEYDNGKLTGNYTTFYKSGKLYREYKFKNGVLSSKFVTECDEFENCKDFFTENFNSKENVNGWKLINEGTFGIITKIIPKQGLLISSGDDIHSETINIPINFNNNFSIETVFEFKDGFTNKGNGIIWGFKDTDNFNYFIINSDGSFKILSKIEGINLVDTEWISSKAINKNYQTNKLKIYKLSNKLHYIINGKIIFETEYYKPRSYNTGFIVSNNQEVLFKELRITQDINNLDKGNQNNESIWKGNGTGFFIDKNGYIATNFHVVKEAEKIEVEFVRNGHKKKFFAKVIQSDKQNDITIIKIISSDFQPFNNLPFNFKTKISDVGSSVFALGYPLALSLMGSEIKFTDGRISSKTGIQGDITSYQISVPIQPGNSGGPLFDFDGNLIGITSSGINRKLDITENVNYAIKSSYLKNLIDVLDYKLSLPNDSSIANLTLTEKIKKISDYVVLIKIK